MLTLVSPARVRDDRPAYRPYQASVARLERLTGHFVMVTFTGDQFADFGTDRLDQRIKILFPIDGELADVGATDPESIRAGSWYARWRGLPDHARNPFRTYTVRAVRPEARELDVVFVDHGPGGPAAAWLASARPGSEVVIVGPDANSLDSAIGIDWHPGAANTVLLAGDETAAPAICSILESLPAGISAHAFIEVPTAADELPIESGADVAAHWIARGDAPLGSRLAQAVRSWVGDNPAAVAPSLAAERVELDDIDVDVELLWDSPTGTDSPGFYAWLAGESGVIKLLRRFLVSETGIDRRQVAFMGYWRLGKSEAQ